MRIIHSIERRKKNKLRYTSIPTQQCCATYCQLCDGKKAIWRIACSTYCLMEKQKKTNSRKKNGNCEIHIYSICSVAMNTAINTTIQQIHMELSRKNMNCLHHLVAISMWMSSTNQRSPHNSQIWIVTISQQVTCILTLQQQYHMPYNTHSANTQATYDVVSPIHAHHFFSRNYWVARSFGAVCALVENSNTQKWDIQNWFSCVF